MRTLFDDRVRDETLERIGRLTAGQTPRWGRMTASQMVVHLTDAFALYSGELKAAAKRTPAQYFPLKQLFIYWVPIPRNVPTAPELKARVPGAWETEVEALRQAVRRFAAEHARTDWPPHPLFGRMSRRACGVLAYRHTDHHLRQFGV